MVHFNLVAGGVYEVVFDLENSRVNVLNQQVLSRLESIVDQLIGHPKVTALMFRSAKQDFIVGADISEFGQIFSQLSAEEIGLQLEKVHRIFNRIEDLAIPTVSLINGIALGGGFELSLATDYRIATKEATVGLPEVKLGIMPGWGGSVRLPRLIGVDNANEWICSGKTMTAESALKVGAIDAIVSSDHLIQSALDLLQDCQEGVFDYPQRKFNKKEPMKMSQVEQIMAFESARGLISAKVGPHYPAPVAAMSSMQKSITLARDKALLCEIKHFTPLAHGSVCRNLVGLFFKDQFLKNKYKQWAGTKVDKHSIAVVGAGIMGTGIAFQSALKECSVSLIDVDPELLNRSRNKIFQWSQKRFEKGRITEREQFAVSARVSSAVDYQSLESCSIAVEAVSENETLKVDVLKRIEKSLGHEGILTTNTSTLTVDRLAAGLQKPERFCGLHFFNPVEKMPLIEVVKGRHTSLDTLKHVVAFALRLGKKPIVANDGAGFLVNRILFPYLIGFNGLLQSGGDFQYIDKVIKGFGWPMGPAELLDSVGIDTACQASKVMAAAYPQRMFDKRVSAIELLKNADRLGVKNQRGFYCYQKNNRGRVSKDNDVDVAAILAPVVVESHVLSVQDIISRLMIPMCIEAVRCYEEQVVSSAAEIDLALVYGIGFPAFLGGALQYIDDMGMLAFCQLCDEYAQLGTLYQPTDSMLERAKTQQKFFPEGA